MLLPLSLLSTFINTDASPQKVADAFFDLGFGVESIRGDIIDLEITPNRGDALSVLGLAREYSAYVNRPLHVPFYDNTYLQTPGNKDWSVKIDTSSVPLYIGLVVDIERNTSSPQWIKDILNIYGVNSINTVVDITNITMLLYGQPLHAFDCDTLKSKKITIRESLPSESIGLLNGKTVALPQGSLVMDDGAFIIDLVGIQGGKKTGVTTNSQKIILHAIDCDPAKIRTTSKQISLQTESSYRFERGIDRGGAHRALSYAMSLITKLCTGKVIQIITDEHYESRSLELNHAHICKVLGTTIPSKDCLAYLQRLGFSIQDTHVHIPSWRLHDIFFEEDIIEEIARLYGYNNLHKEPLPYICGTKMPTQPLWDKQREVASHLKMFGFDEVITYSFISSKNIEDGDAHLYKEVCNPLSRDHSYLRMSLIPLLVKAAERNNWIPSLALFEIGSVFSTSEEKTHIALISTQKIPFIDNTQCINVHQPPYMTKRKYYVWEGSLEKFMYEPPQSVSVQALKTFPYKNISKYQPTVIDVACIIDTSITIEQLREAIHSVDTCILLIEPFDIYSNASFGDSKISYAFHILLDNRNNDFTAGSIQLITRKIHTVLEQTFNAQIR